MFEALPHPYRVPCDGSFSYAEAPTGPEEKHDKREMEQALAQEVTRLHELQRVFYAHNRHSLLLIFQAMDAAGKDSTIRAVMSGVDPSGCQVFSFKQPSSEELDHDFLWRSSRCLPERGRIGIFNRSYYEEVLVVRVHPHFLEQQQLPHRSDEFNIWEERFESMRDLEKHLARNGTVILKFWLNVSRDEQRERFLSRLREPEKNWKFSVNDVQERSLWYSYMNAYQEMLNATSRPWAPWYAIPADNKPYMRLTVAQIIRQTLESLSLDFPAVNDEVLTRFAELRRQLENDEI